MKNVIYKKGFLQAPVHLQDSILKYAENRLLIEEDQEIRFRQYLEWIPGAFLLLILRDLLKGRDISIRPEIDY